PCFERDFNTVLHDDWNDFSRNSPLSSLRLRYKGESCVSNVWQPLEQFVGLLRDLSKHFVKHSSEETLTPNQCRKITFRRRPLAEIPNFAVQPIQFRSELLMLLSSFLPSSHSQFICFLCVHSSELVFSQLIRWRTRLLGILERQSVEWVEFTIIGLRSFLNVLW